MRPFLLANLLALSILSSSVWGQASNDPNANQNGLGTAASSGVPPIAGEQVLQVYRDAWGREMERVRITRAVPVHSYQPKELKETRVVQEWIYENRPSTQYSVTPSTQYQLQQRIKGRFNPFVQPQVVAEYVPVTQYQQTPTTVNVPMAVPKYTTREYPRWVWDLVQTTKMEQFEVIRPRQAQGTVASGNGGSNNTAFNASVPAPEMNRTNMPQASAQLAMAQRSTSNPSPFPLTPISASYAAPQSVAPIVPLSSLAAKPLIDPKNWFGGTSNRLAQVNPIPFNAAQSQYNPPSWNGTQPIFGSSPLAAARWNPPSANSPRLRPTTAGVLPNASLPQTASLQGYGTVRDPMQAGFRASELR